MSCHQEDAGGLKQGLDDEAEPVIAESQALVIEQPSVGILDDGTDNAEPGAVVGTDLADYGLDALAQTEPAVVGAVVPGIPCPGSGCAARGE